MATSSHQEVYVDPWQEFKGISGKLKNKRFFHMKKPNVSEAMRELRQLARRLEEEDCRNYAGFCHLEIARRDQKAGNIAGETGALTQAARQFMKAEEERQHLGLPGFQQNLTSAIHCFGHAIKTHSEQGQTATAAALCLELGRHLHQLDRPFEAVEHFERAWRFFEEDPINRMEALQWLATAQAELGRYSEALEAVERRWTIADSLRHAEDIQRDCEMATVVLVLALRPLPRHLNRRQTDVWRLYTWVAEVEEEVPPMEARVRSPEEFLLLQSLVLAAQWKEAASADRCLTQLLPALRSSFLLGLAYHIVDSLYKCKYSTD